MVELLGMVYIFFIALGGYQPLSQAPDGADSEDSDDDFADFQTATEQKKVGHRRIGIHIYIGLLKQLKCS